MTPPIATTYRRPVAAPDVLWDMYHSDELFNEGISSFEYPIYHASDEELDLFLGKLVRNVGRAASSVGRAVGSAVKTVGKGVSSVTKVIPFDAITTGLTFTPLGMAVRAGLGAAKAAAEGKNVFQGAARTLASTPVTKFAVDTAAGVARGQNIGKAIGQAGKAGLDDARQSLRFAATVAPFVPGLGTGIGIALGAANALASGERITDAVIAAARGAIPGGAIAQSAFDVATNVIKGQNLSDAALGALRSQLPPGPAQMAFDTGLAVAKGQKIQDALIEGGAKFLPKSPYTSDITSFLKKAANGENIAKAALSTVGNLALKKIQQQGGGLLPNFQSPLPIPAGAGAGVGSFLQKAASGQNLSKAAFSTASDLARRRIQQRATSFLPKLPSRLPIPPRLPRLPGIPGFQGELSSSITPPAPGGRGTWMRYGDQIVIELPR